MSRRNPWPVDIGRGGKLWPGEDGSYQASDSGGWLPGIYVDEAAARRALELCQSNWPAVAAVAATDRGEGDQYRYITLDELNQADGSHA